MAADTSLDRAVSTNTAATKAATSNLSAADAALASLGNVSAAASDLVSSNAAVNTGTTSNTAITSLTPKTPSGDTGNTNNTGDTALTKQITDLQNQVKTLQNTQTSAAAQAAAAQVGQQQNALQLLQSTLSGFNIDTTGSISSAILGLLQKNYDAATIQSLIQDPNAAASTDPNVVALANAWNTRFSGNVAREKAGLPPLSTADYISTENSYKAVMQQAGLPASAMDPAYLGQLIGKDVSPTETQQRVNSAMAALQSEDPNVIAQLQSQFGLDRGALALHLLDPNLASNVIQQQVTAAQIGAEASRQNANIAYGGTGPLSAMSLAAQGITQSQAAQGFQQIAQQQTGLQGIAARYQGLTGPANVGAAVGASVFGTSGAAQATQQLNLLKTAEESTFGGSAGASTGSLGVKDVSGLS
jgi:hypothetical protein